MMNWWRSRFPEELRKVFCEKWEVVNDGECHLWLRGVRFSVKLLYLVHF
jgi:hypothetical protein